MLIHKASCSSFPYHSSPINPFTTSFILPSPHHRGAAALGLSLASSIIWWHFPILTLPLPSFSKRYCHLLRPSSPSAPFLPHEHSAPFSRPYPVNHQSRASDGPQFTTTALQIWTVQLRPLQVSLPKQLNNTSTSPQPGAGRSGFGWGRGRNYERMTGIQHYKVWGQRWRRAVCKDGVSSPQ